MTAMHFQAKALGESCAFGNRRAFLLAPRSGRVAVSAGVDFDRVGAHLPSRFDLRVFGIDEQADVNTALLQSGHRILHFCLMRDYIKAALGGQLFTLFRDKAGVGWM